MAILSALVAVFLLISASQASDPKALTIKDNECHNETAEILVDSDATVNINFPFGDTDVDPVNAFKCTWDVSLNETLTQDDAFLTLNINSAKMPNGTNFKVGCVHGSFKKECGPNVRGLANMCPTKMIIPCNNMTLLFQFNKRGDIRRYQMNTGVNMLDQTILPTNNNNCPSPLSLKPSDKNKTISFFDSFYTKGHRCEVDVKVSNETYIIEYVSASNTDSSYTLYDSNSRDIQIDCSQKPSKQGACFPRSTTKSNGAIWAEPILFNENSRGPIPLTPPAVVFKLSAVASAEVQHGTQNCYCGLKDLSLNFVQSPNYGGTGACANMQCTYMISTSDHTKLLHFTTSSTSSSSVSTPASKITAVSVGYAYDDTADFFTRTAITPTGPYLYQKCDITLTAASSNAGDDNTDCGYKSSYQPKVTYNDYTSNCVVGLTISIYDGSDSTGALLGTINGCSGAYVSATSTTKKLYLVWQRENADISRQVQLSTYSDYQLGNYKSCYNYNYGWVWYAVLIPVLCAIVFITIIYTIRYRRMRLMRRGVVHAQAPTAMYTIPSQNQMMYATPQAYQQQQMQQQSQMMSPTPPPYANVTATPTSTTRAPNT